MAESLEKILVDFQELTGESNELLCRLILSKADWDLKGAFELYENAIDKHLENRIVIMLERDRIDISLPIYELKDGEENIDWNELVISLNAELGETEEIIHKKLLHIRKYVCDRLAKKQPKKQIQVVRVLLGEYAAKRYCAEFDQHLKALNLEKNDFNTTNEDNSFLQVNDFCTGTDLHNPKLIPSGSYVEGGSIARTMLFAAEGNYEQDLLYVFAELEHEGLLHGYVDQPAFVKIRFTPDKSSYLSKVHDHYFSCDYCDDKICVNDKYRETIICAERMKNNGNKYLNGLNIKKMISITFCIKHLSDVEKNSILRKCTPTFALVEEPCVSKPNIQYIVKSKSLYNIIGYMLLEYALILKVFENMDRCTRIRLHEHYRCNYMETSTQDDQLNLLDVIAQADVELNIPGMNDRNIISHLLMGCMFGLALPKDLLLKLRSLIEFYFSYKSLIVVRKNEQDRDEKLEEITDDSEIPTILYDLGFRSGKGQDGNDKWVLRQIPDPICPEPKIIELDLVPAVELMFWPKIMTWFSERMENNLRWAQVFKEKVFNKAKIYLVSKCSPKTYAKYSMIPGFSTHSWDMKNQYPIEASCEFRYSFSAVEAILANERTQKEAAFNHIVKILYYKYIRPIHAGESSEQYLPSYFVKTTVFWMLESSVDAVKSLELRELLRLWMKKTVKDLQDGVCRHYFIPNLNILENYDVDLLDEIAAALVSLEKTDLKELIAVDEKFLTPSGISIHDELDSIIEEEFVQLINKYFNPKLKSDVKLLLHKMFYIDNICPNFLLKWYNMFLQQTNDNNNEICYSSNLTPFQLLSIFENVAAYATGILIPFIIKKFHDVLNEANLRDQSVTEEVLVNLETALLMSPVESWSTNEGQQITLNYDRNVIIFDGGVPPTKPTTFFPPVLRSLPPTLDRFAENKRNHIAFSVHRLILTNL